MYFPEFTISSDTNVDDVDFTVNEKKVKYEKVVVSLEYIRKFPLMTDHNFHCQVQAAGLIEPLDERVQENIKRIVCKEVRMKAEILSRMADFVGNELP